MDAATPQAPPVHPPELWLEIDDSLISRLERDPALATLRVSAAPAQDEETLYFDTPTLEIVRSGLFLAIRGEAAGRRQILGCLDRPEGRLPPPPSEWPARSASPDLALVPDLSLIRDPRLSSRLPARPVGQLAPVFATRLRRAPLILELPPGMRSEAAVVTGTCGGGKADASSAAASPAPGRGQQRYRPL